MKYSRLRACVELHLERVIVLPGDVRSSGPPDNSSSAKCFALFTRSFVFRRVPSLSGFPALRVQRNRFSIAFGRYRHSRAPVFGDQGDPISGDINGRGCSWRGRWSRWLPNARRLCESDTDCGCAQDQRSQQMMTMHVHKCLFRRLFCTNVLTYLYD